MSLVFEEFAEQPTATHANVAEEEDGTVETGLAAGDREPRQRTTPCHQARVLPTITEDDLLKFQFQHFGDDTMPETFFVDEDTALNFQPWAEDVEVELDDDELGYYADGTKRTLTDEQIELFRHTEIQQMLREATLRNDELIEPDQVVAVHDHEHQRPPPPRSPALSDSSIEADLVGLSRTIERENQRSPIARRQSSQSRSETTSRYTGTSKKKKRKKQVPFEQRHKRRWEQYIEGEDEAHGSLTQRRMVRELDDREEEQVDMDY